MKTLRGNNILIIFALILSFAQFQSVFAGESEIVRIGACDYPPYEFEKPEGNLRGFDVEVVEAAFRREGITAKFEFYPWARAVQMGKDGDVAALLSVAKNEERESWMLLSDPISAYSLGCIVRKEYSGPPLKKLEEVRGRNVGTMQDYVPADMMKKLGIQHDLSTTDEIGLRKLADRRIDVLVTSIENTLYLIKKKGMAERFKWFVYEKMDFHLGFSRKRPEARKLLERFNKGLKAVREDGTLDAIHGKYR